MIFSRRTLFAIIAVMAILGGLSAQAEQIAESFEPYLELEFEAEAEAEAEGAEPPAKIEKPQPFVGQSAEPEIDLGGVGPIVREIAPPVKKPPQINLQERTFFAPRRDSQQSAQNSQIWKVFVKNFNKCAPGCEPVKYHAYRSPQVTVGCHRVGRALDVFGIKCDGKVYMAEAEMYKNGRFNEFAGCMKKRMVTLWRNGGRSNKTLNHWDHIHVSIGCKSAYGGNYW